MTTQLAAIPICEGQQDLLDEITDTQTPLGSLHRDDFEAACRAVATWDRWVDPNLVSAELHRRFGEINVRAYSAMWAGACGPNGFLDKSDHLVPIDPKHSRGNGGKKLYWRRLRVAS